MNRLDNSHSAGSRAADTTSPGANRPDANSVCSPADATSSTHTRREWVTPLGNAWPAWTFSSVTSAATPPPAAVTHSRALNAACRSRSMPAARRAVSGHGISGWSMPGNWWSWTRRVGMPGNAAAGPSLPIMWQVAHDSGARPVGPTTEPAHSRYVDSTATAPTSTSWHAPHASDDARLPPSRSGLRSLAWAGVSTGSAMPPRTTPSSLRVSAPLWTAVTPSIAWQAQQPTPRAARGTASRLVPSVVSPSASAVGAWQPTHSDPSPPLVARWPTRLSARNTGSSLA